MEHPPGPRKCQEAHTDAENVGECTPWAVHASRRQGQVTRPCCKAAVLLQQIENCGLYQKERFKITLKLLHRMCDTPLPKCTSAMKLAIKAVPWLLHHKGIQDQRRVWPAGRCGHPDTVEPVVCPAQLLRNLHWPLRMRSANWSPRENHAGVGSLSNKCSPEQPSTTLCPQEHFHLPTVQRNTCEATAKEIFSRHRAFQEFPSSVKPGLCFKDLGESCAESSCCTSERMTLACRFSLHIIWHYLRKHSVNFHGYADNQQVCASFTFSSQGEANVSTLIWRVALLISVYGRLWTNSSSIMTTLKSLLSHF